MGLAVSDEGMESPHVCSFVGIEAEDREERGHSLSILSRERHTLLYAVPCALYNIPSSAPVVVDPESMIR